jgi:hypothetical protein
MSEPLHRPPRAGAPGTDAEASHPIGPTDHEAADELANLRRAVAHRPVIDMAKGILIAGRVATPSRRFASSSGSPNTRTASSDRWPAS